MSTNLARLRIGLDQLTLAWSCKDWLNLHNDCFGCPFCYDNEIKCSINTINFKLTEYTNNQTMENKES